MPYNDPVFSPVGKECLQIYRSVIDDEVNCPEKVHREAEQITATTSFMDLSLVYGNDFENLRKVRAFYGGRLISVDRGGQCYPPQVDNVTHTCKNVHSVNEPCYQTGDKRTNQSPHLAILQIILMREHNRLADELHRINPQWNDERIFQEARHINIGQIQHINYYEWMPITLGECFFIYFIIQWRVSTNN